MFRQLAAVEPTALLTDFNNDLRPDPAHIAQQVRALEYRVAKLEQQQ